MVLRAAMGVAWLLGLCRLSAAQLRVLAPQSLVQEFAESRGRIEGSTATFGAPYYGDRLLGRLVWGDSLKNHTHCTEDDYQVPPPDEVPVEHRSYKEVRLIHIVMVRRGKCSFVTKVQVARKKGAHAVIIVDKEDSQLTPHEIKRIIVADDGYGRDIDIPSILISQEEGRHLIAAAKRSQVIVELAWDVPTNHVVIVDLWMSSASRESQRFLQEFAANRRALNEAIKFVPHYHIFGMQSTKDYSQLCVDESAAYCAEDPDGSGPITGKMVIEEDLRQLCIHELTKVKRLDLDNPSLGITGIEYAEKYWNYVERFPTECQMEDFSRPHFGKTCSENLMKKLDIDVDLVAECVRATRDEKLKQQRANVAWSPRALRINGWRYSGTLDADLVTRAICAGFVRQPAECKTLVEPVNPFALDTAPPPDGVGIGTFVIGLFLVAGVTMGALFLYKRSLTRHIHTALREEVMLEVQAQMGSYKMMS